MAAVSQLSTYLAGALFALLLIDHAPSLGILPPASEWMAWPAEIAGPATTIDRARKGDRLLPEPARHDARPAEAPLDVVELSTGSIGERRSAPAAAANNVTVLVKRAPLRDPPRARRALPVGCESAFGRLAAPPLAQVPGRCIM